MTNMTRRGALGTIGIAAGAVAAGPVPGAPRQPKPLRFDPAKLNGLSERLIRSHWENNYIGSVKALAMVEGRMASAMADKDFPPLVYGGLKREQLHRTGSVILHEHYFDGLGGNGVAAGSIKPALAATWGSFEAWEAEFRRTAMALAGGSGWAVLSFNLCDGRLGNFWASDHMQQPAGGVPLIALDMYEHAFHIDYGAAAAKYVDAFMRNLDWEVIEKRWLAVKDIRTTA